MMNELCLYWLTPAKEIADEVRAAQIEIDDEIALNKFVKLANGQLNFVKTQSLDLAFRRRFTRVPQKLLRRPIERLAILGSSTTSHLLPGVRMGALRRGFWVETYESGYSQYVQEIFDSSSGLHHFKPTAVILCLDARHLLAGDVSISSNADAEGAADLVAGRLCDLWQRCRNTFSSRVIQQTVAPVFEPSFGHNERRFHASLSGLVDRVNDRLRDLAEREQVDLLTVDTLVRRYGLFEVHDPSYWHRAKQEIRPAFGHVFGEHLGRILSAQIGLSSKCLVLDLDNTLWGGVVGDDGVEGIILGQGNPLGEAFIAFQKYVLELARRGVIVAVCSKNEEATARLPFSSHPEMLLKEDHVACFVANWQDKAANLRRISNTLNLGLDALVFVDDNPVERALVRRELPEVAVPELPDDPALYARCLADAGYFESVRFTADDAERTERYLGASKRQRLAETAIDLPGFLKSLEMRLEWKAFDKIGLPRIAQLVNKSNQFNLTTRRYNSSQLAEFMGDRRYLTLQIRLTDRLGDNGMIAVIIGRRDEQDPSVLTIDTWLMSCRVLGRQVEETTLNVLVGCAERLGVRFLIGEFRPTAKNALVRDHYPRLGFTPKACEASNRSKWMLDINTFEQLNTYITTTESVDD
jgi:FkbH-like protein